MIARGRRKQKLIEEESFGTEISSKVKKEGGVVGFQKELVTSNAIYPVIKGQPYRHDTHLVRKPLSLWSFDTDYETPSNRGVRFIVL